MYERCHSADNVSSLHAFAMFTECEDVEKYRETLRVPQMRGYHSFSGQGPNSLKILASAAWHYPNTVSASDRKLPSIARW